MLGRVFKAYDIRGIYPDLLTDQMAHQIGAGASRYLLADAHAAGETSPMMRNIVVGRDMRISSPTLSEWLIAGINRHGGDVIDLGMVDTPFVYFAINHIDCAGGIMVTASHNPPQYNGFKISKRRASPVGETSGLAEIRKYAAVSDKSPPAALPVCVEKRDFWDAYIEHVRSFIELSRRSLKIVVDASNGMAGTMAPKVFGPNGESIDGLEIIELNFDNSKGEFAHEPNPLVASNLVQLQAAVVEHRADLGICFDGDADRCVFVDEKGAIVGCDLITALLAKHFLAQNPGGAVVYDLRSTKAVKEEIIKAGGKPVRGRVGHVFMKAAMAEHEAPFGGELSGHFYFRNNYYADSGAMAVTEVVTALVRAGTPLSRLIEPARRYVQSGEINFETDDKEAALEELKEAYQDGTIDELDGVTVDTGRWWCNVRPSNTEPLLRLNLEAPDPETVDAQVIEVSRCLGRRV